MSELTSSRLDDFSDIVKYLLTVMITIFFGGEEAGHFLLGGKLLPLKYRTLPAGMFATFLLLKMPSTVYACKLLVETNV